MSIKNDPKHYSTTRRNLIKGTGAILVGGAAGGFAANKFLASEKPKNGSTKGQDYDVVVIGGGFAGATAARELGTAGLNVTVLEGRNRLGGRTFTSNFAGHTVEFGGTWIHWLQPHVWAEVSRYQLELAESPTATPNRGISLNRKGARREREPAEMAAELATNFNLYCQDAWKYFPRPYDPLFNKKEVLELDKLSMRDRLNSLDITRDEADVIGSIMALLTGGNLNDGAFSQQLRTFAAGGWNFASYMDTLNRYKFKHGTISLIEAMISESGAEVYTGTTVSKIKHKKDEVVITTEDGETLSARACIISVPINTLRYIDFEPGLPANKQKIVKDGQMSRGIKTYVKVKGDVGNILAVAPDNQPLVLLQTEYQDADSTIIIGFGSSDSLLDINDQDAVASAVKKFIPDADVISTAGYDWNNDPFSDGSWPAFRTNELKRISDLQQNINNLFFAGAITASGWYQFIDGAIESGLRESRKVKEYLA